MGSAQGAIDRYRDLAKYLIGIFAAVGGILVAGTQLASIGSLSFHHQLDRVLAAAGGLIAALGAVAWIMRAALKVLRPFEMSLDTVLADKRLREAVDARPTLLGDAGDTAGLYALLRTVPADKRGPWKEIADDVIDHAAFVTTQRRFDAVWWHMLGAAWVGVLGIVAFAWGANPPKDSAHAAKAIVPPQPVVVVVSLEEEGREALAQAIGRRCVQGRFRALSIGGTAHAPLIVTLPEHRCRAAQFALDPSWGHASSTERAPAG